jgi:hypothetical protein
LDSLVPGNVKIQHTINPQILTQDKERESQRREKRESQNPRLNRRGHMATGLEARGERERLEAPGSKSSHARSVLPNRLWEAGYTACD